MGRKGEYNQTAIDVEEEFVEDFFNNFEKYKEKYSSDKIFNSIDFDTLSKKNALDNYILKKYFTLDRNNPVDEKILENMDKYLKSFYKKFLQNPTKYLGSPFLESPAIVDLYCPKVAKLNGKNIKLPEEVKKTYRSRMGNSESKEFLYIRDRNTNSLSKEETDLLNQIFINSIGTENKKIQEYQLEYIKKLIRQKSKVKDLSLQQIEFIAKYFNNSMLKNKPIKSYIYVGKESENLGGYAINDNIYLNKYSNLTQDIPSLIHVICHETEHIIQNYEAKTNPNSKIGLDAAVSNILRLYFNKEKGYDVYNNNYRFEQVEKDAEEVGYTKAITILSELGFADEASKLRKQKNKELNFRRFEYDFRVNENGEKTTREEFIFNNLNEAIEKKPNNIKQYPVLANLYTKEGKVKTFEQIISNEFVLSDRAKSDILDDFCKYYIYKGKLSELDLNKFPENVQANISSRLISILGSEGAQIGDMAMNSKIYYRYIDPEDKLLIENFHLEISSDIMQFIDGNYEHIMDLQINNKFSSIIDMSYYISYATQFGYKDFYEGLETKDSSKIETLKSLSSKANQKHEIARKKLKEERKKQEINQKFSKCDIDKGIEGFIDSTKRNDVNEIANKIKYEENKENYLNNGKNKGEDNNARAR